MTENTRPAAAAAQPPRPVPAGPDPAAGRGETAGAAGGGRLHALDNLRVVLTVLVVLHHSAVTYGNIPVWYYTETARDASGAVLDVFVQINQAFFMGFFFLIAGFFTPGSYRRKGPRRFVRDRLARLGLPLLAYLLLLRPLAGAGAFADVARAVEAQGHAMPYWLYYVVSWDPGPLWFVEVLLVFTLLYGPARRFRAARKPAAAGTGGGLPAQGAAGPAGQDGAVPRPVRLLPALGFGAGLAAVTFLWRFLFPTGTYIPVLGLPTPDFLPQYASFFVLGTLARRRGWIRSLSRRAGWSGFGAAGLATLAYAPVVLTSSPAQLSGSGTWQAAATACWESAFALGLVTGLGVLFRECFGTQGRFGAFCSRHAFAVYVIHAPVLVALAHALRWFQAAAVIKFAVLGVLAVPVCWALAWAVRRIPGVSRVL